MLQLPEGATAERQQGCARLRALGKRRRRPRAAAAWGARRRTAQESLTGGTRLERGRLARRGTALGRRLERGDGNGCPCLRHRRVHLHPRLRTYACSLHRHCPRHRILAMRTPRCNLRSAQARGGGRRRGYGRCSSCQRGRRRSVSKDARACGRLGSVVVGDVRRRRGGGGQDGAGVAHRRHALEARESRPSRHRPRQALGARRWGRPPLPAPPPCPPPSAPPDVRL